MNQPMKGQTATQIEKEYLRELLESWYTEINQLWDEHHNENTGEWRSGIYQGIYEGYSQCISDLEQKFGIKSK